MTNHIFTVILGAYIFEYRPPDKGIALEINLSSTLSIINPERSLETHKIFYPENN